MDMRALPLLRALIPADPGGAAARPAETRTENGVGPRGSILLAPDATDRVFVRDFVLPMSIGAYRREHGAHQRVRFNVDVLVGRPAKTPADMRDILSYDIVMDGIRLIAARHVDLAETLAERVAAMVLAQPRAVKVTVRIEKLDVGPAIVGVEITRERAAGASRDTAPRAP
jgi:dihydroneopterin aldolase